MQKINFVLIVVLCCSFSSLHSGYKYYSFLKKVINVYLAGRMTFALFNHLKPFIRQGISFYNGVKNSRNTLETMKSSHAQKEKLKTIQEMIAKLEALKTSFKQGGNSFKEDVSGDVLPFVVNTVSFEEGAGRLIEKMLFEVIYKIYLGRTGKDLEQGKRGVILSGPPGTGKTYFSLYSFGAAYKAFELWYHKQAEYRGNIILKKNAIEAEMKSYFSNEEKYVDSFYEMLFQKIEYLEKYISLSEERKSEISAFKEEVTSFLIGLKSHMDLKKIRVHFLEPSNNGKSILLEGAKKLQYFFKDTFKIEEKDFNISEILRDIYKRFEEKSSAEEFRVLKQKKSEIGKEIEHIISFENFIKDYPKWVKDHQQKQFRILAVDVVASSFIPSKQGGSSHTSPADFFKKVTVLAHKYPNDIVVINIDEVDQVFLSRDKGDIVRAQLTNEFLVALQKGMASPNILFASSTNCPELIDEALYKNPNRLCMFSAPMPTESVIKQRLSNSFYFGGALKHLSEVFNKGLIYEYAAFLIGLHSGKDKFDKCFSWLRDLDCAHLFSSSSYYTFFTSRTTQKDIVLAKRKKTSPFAESRIYQEKLLKVIEDINSEAEISSFCFDQKMDPADDINRTVQFWGWLARTFEGDLQSMENFLEIISTIGKCIVGDEKEGYKLNSDQSHVLQDFLYKVQKGTLYGKRIGSLLRHKKEELAMLTEYRFEIPQDDSLIFFKVNFKNSSHEKDIKSKKIGFLADMVEKVSSAVFGSGSSPQASL